MVNYANIRGVGEIARVQTTWRGVLFAILWDSEVGLLVEFFL